MTKARANHVITLAHAFRETLPPFWQSAADFSTLSFRPQGSASACDLSSDTTEKHSRSSGDAGL